MDLVALVAHHLRHNRQTNLTVPDGAGWPDEARWNRAGLQVMARDGEGYHLHAGPLGQLSWVPPEGLSGLAQALEAPLLRRKLPLTADPAIQRLGVENYLSPGQAAAVRAALLLHPGQALAVDLPTGSGKSLIPFAAARLGLGPVVVAVPTIALGLDQAIRYAQETQAAGHDAFVWHGDLEQEQRQRIWSSVARGEQSILFASPESLTTGLQGALFAAARRGQLGYLVVDEAHLITEWGSDFRPAFQALAGLWRGLCRVAPEGRAPRLVLMTGTLTPDTFDTIEVLFAEKGGLFLVSGGHLRSELLPCFMQTASAEERENRVLELLPWLPRPLILYVSRRGDAENWEARLRQDGYRRVAHMHGRTSAQERERLLRRWRDREIDLMVATSAFGLGVDQADVRAVVHACIPETIHRYYQELGRGGRDGRAAVGLLISAPGDERIATGISRRRYIGRELGRERWRAMLGKRKGLDGGRVVLPLDAKHGRLQQDSDENVAWNLRLLVLMARMDMIRLGAAGSGEGSADEAAHEGNANKETRRPHQVVRVLAGADNDDAWARFATARLELKKRDKASFARMLAVVQHPATLPQVLRSTYAVGGLTLGPSPPELVEEPEIAYVPSPTLKERLTTRWIGYEAIEGVQLIEELLKLMANEYGIREIVVTADGRTLAEDALRRVPRFTLLRDLSEERWPVRRRMQLPRITVLGPSLEGTVPPPMNGLDGTTFHATLFPGGMQDPIRPDRRFADVQTSVSAARVLERLRR